MSPPEVLPIHHNCVACLSVVDNLSKEDSVLTLLIMLSHGHDPDQMHRDLCFKHRRLVEECAKKIDEELGA